MEGGVEGFICHLIPPERISSLISVSSYIDNLPSARLLQPSLCHAQMEWQCLPHHIGFQSLNRHLTAENVHMWTPTCIHCATQKGDCAICLLQRDAIPVPGHPLWGFTHSWCPPRTFPTWDPIIRPSWANVSSTLSSPTILRGLEYRHISGELAWNISQPQGLGQLPTRADISMDWPSQLFSEVCISLPCYIANQDEWGSVLS